jgi:hypothetical protein
MPSQSNRRQPAGPPAPRRPSESRANLDPGAYIGRKPERPAEPPDRDATTTSTTDRPSPRRRGDEAGQPNQGEGGRNP